MTYALTVTVTTPFTATVENVRGALQTQGFGILTEIDINATFTAKLGSEPAAQIGDYVILGACNPPLAHQALTADPGIGLLLPCNVVVRRASGATETTVQAIDAATMVQLSAEPDIAAVAAQADTKLRAALAALPGLAS
ncbi:MAG: DUF302 domain-containing protein [Cryobacterium sp.]